MGIWGWGIYHVGLGHWLGVWGVGIWVWDGYRKWERYGMDSGYGTDLEWIWHHRIIES